MIIKMQVNLKRSFYLAIVSLANLADGLRDLRVLVARLDQPQRGLACEVGGHHDVRLAPGDRGLGSGAQHPAV